MTDGRRPTGRRGPLTEIGLLDEVLHSHAASLGPDLAAYRNHAYRVANFCLAFPSQDADVLPKAAIAAACHDIGIWSAGTFDYLEPSAGAAVRYLARSGRSEWADEITTVIREHHKLRPYHDSSRGLVESFRRADLVDLSRGLVTFGLPRGFLTEVFSLWPNAGFHKLLLRLALGRARTHPWSPLPMLRL